HGRQHHLDITAARCELRPRPERRDHEDDEEQERLVDRPLEGHALDPDPEPRQAREGLLVQAGVTGTAHWKRHRGISLANGRMEATRLLYQPLPGPHSAGGR